MTDLAEQVKKLEARVAELEKNGGKPKKEKKERKPTEFNKFIKDNLAKVKAENPSMSHTEAFSATAKLYKERQT